MKFVGNTSAETRALRIIGTNDLHGKFLPWDYGLNAESTSGSVAQLSTAIARFRDDNTLLVDAGDLIQFNSANIFVGGEDVHPMVQAINALNYDVWVPGNHDYNYGMDVTRKTIADMNCRVLTCNVYDENGCPIADGCTIIDKDGVRVAVIGMVTQNIARWDAVNLANCTVTDPLEETRKIIDAIRGRYDVLVGVYHMGIRNEYGVANSGVSDILNTCPEFDVMVAAHSHVEIPGKDINGVLVVSNKGMAQTMAVIDLTLEKDGDSWKVTEKTSDTIKIAGFESDPAIVELLCKYHEQARADAEQVIGTLEGGALSPENEIAGIPAARIQDTALIDLINAVQMYYTDAPVSCAALFTRDANLYPGNIRRCDISLIYRFTNTLYMLHMTGAQLKKYMEWSVSYFNTFKPGDRTISINPDFRHSNYIMFAGVNYEVNIAKAPGSRIENLTWPDGTPVKDEDEFDIAVSDYQANSILLDPGQIFEKSKLPALLEMDVRGDIGGVRELICDYIINVKNGVITPECDENWKITGYSWDPKLRR